MACLLSLVDCSLGPHVGLFPLAYTPEGVEVEASVASASADGARTDVKGELLEVRREGLLALGAVVEVRKKGRLKVPMQHPDGGKRVVLVPFDRILTARFVGMGSCCELRDGIVPTDAVRDRLRLVSRFPQGLAPDLLLRLLASQGQAEIQRLGP